MTLKEYMAAHNIRAETIAKKVPCSLSAVRKWVAGVREPRQQHKYRLEKISHGAVTLYDWD